MLCVTIDPVEAFFLMRGQTRYISDGGCIQLSGRAWLRMTQRDGFKRRLIIDRYLYLNEHYPDLAPSPVEWTKAVPMRHVVGSAVFAERLPRAAVELNEVERLVLELKPFVYRLTDFEALPSPVRHYGKGAIFTVDEDLKKVSTQSLTDQLLHDFYDLLVLVDQMKNPFTAAAQTQIKRHPGFKIRTARWSGKPWKGIFHFLYGKGWTVVRNPPWRTTFAERFPGFE